MSDDSDSDPASGLDLKTLSKGFATDRAKNSIRIRRSKLGHSHPLLENEVGSPSSQEDQLTAIANIAETKFSPEIIQNSFSSPDGNLNQFTFDLALFIKTHPEISIITDPEQIELIVNAIGFYTDDQAITNFLFLILVLAGKFDNEIVDDGFFFLVRDEPFQTFPAQVLEFYQAIANQSKYCVNALICTGILYDIFDLFSQTEDANLIVQASKTIDAIMSVATNEDADSLREFITNVVTMLNCQNIEAIAYILRAINNMIRISTSFITVFFQAQLHTIIANFMPQPELSKVCLDILGSMCVCSDKQFPLLFPLVEIACTLIGGDFTGDVYWTLMNALDSCPLKILPFIDTQFIINTAQILNNSSFAIMRDVACFAATLLVVAPLLELKNIIAHGIIGPLIDMLDCGDAPLVLRCLDGLKKVVMAAYSDPSIVGLAPDMFESDELEEALSRLHENEDPRINSRAVQLMSELESITQSS